jgi:branched-chain amino acid transport system substrate-binding protein
MVDCGLSTRRPKLRCKPAIGVASTVLLMLTAACTKGADAADTSPIVIAASLERSGSGATVGQAYERAMKLEASRLNAGDTLGGRKVRVDVKDNRTESSTALSQVTEFTGDPEVTAIVMGVCGECAVAAAKVVEDRGVPTITLAPASQMLSPLDQHKNLFKLAPNPVDNATSLVAELIRNGVSSIGLMSPDDTYGKEAAEALETVLRKTGISIVPGKFRPGDGDLTTTARTVANAHPAAVVVLAFPAQAAIAAKNLRDVGYQGKLFFDGSAAGDLFLSGAAASAEGGTMIFLPTLAIDDVIATTPAKAARKQWFEDYTSRYGVYQGQSSFAADAVRLIADAVVKAGSTERSVVRTRLESTRVDGISGPIRITPNNHSGLMPQALTVLVARNGRWRLLG